MSCFSFFALGFLSSWGQLRNVDKMNDVLMHDVCSNPIQTNKEEIPTFFACAFSTLFRLYSGFYLNSKNVTSDMWFYTAESLIFMGGVNRYELGRSCRTWVMI